MSTVIDFSASFPRAADIRAAGHEGVVCYVSPPREPWMRAKPLTKAVAAAYRAAGLKIGAAWQYGGASNPDVMRGAAGGRADALAADNALKAAGLAGWPVFFAVDFDITLDQWNSTAVAYFLAACDVLGRQRVGIYGHSRVVAWAQEDGVVADLGEGRCLGWVTRSWSQGETGSGYAALYQRVHNTPGPSGVQIDINDVYSTAPFTAPSTPPKETPVVDTIAPNPNHRGDPTFLPDLLRAWGLTVRELDGWRDRGEGDFTNIIGVMCHHTAGANTSAQYIAVNPGLDNGLSSQLHLARDGVVTICGAGVAWHAGGDEPRTPAWAKGQVKIATRHENKWQSVGNAKMIGIEAVNSGDGRQDWPEVQLDSYAAICAAICWYLGLPVDRVIGHKEFAPTRKIDPNFDMGGFRDRVRKRLANPPTAPTSTKQEDDMFTDSDREALLDCRAMLQTLCAQDMGDPGVTGPYGGWPQTGGRTRTDTLAAIAAKLGITGTTDTKEA
ncbi:glycoside hydrolase domain-containing protein [Corynebacterium neomassiliense]|uniref:glycoside hydrolase domain-containing protein n=1 Tax=Corynebacterium neomassiliense TaxID=2079482 RepID=UPI0010326B47|nr:glycoside hydrolase domain-containing protein [Corynebacterium neomassiliense]